jgi:UDP-N-acetylglucosamine 2-epimerase
MKIANVVGARPKFIKVAPGVRAIDAANGIEQVPVHAGQHYEPSLSDDSFHDLELQTPGVKLGFGAGPHDRSMPEEINRLATRLALPHRERLPMAAA